MNLKAENQVKMVRSQYISMDKIMKISFGKKVITTILYIKLISLDQLLLLEIVSYYSNVKSINRCQPTVDVSCTKHQKETLLCDRDT